MARIAPAPTDVLLIVDVQNDFLSGGPLAVPGGEAVIAPINVLARAFDRASAHVVLTQDWHPAGHVSFASAHGDRAPGDTLALPDGRRQVLWPDHCVRGTPGAALAAALVVPGAELVIRKGYRRDLDSYSAFLEADGTTRTGLAGYLRERGLTRVFVAGLATDFCAGWTAVDAARAGFATTMITDAVAGIDVDGSMARMRDALRDAGVMTTDAATLLRPRAHSSLDRVTPPD